MSSKQIRFLLVLPALVVLGTFFVYPILLTFYYSFTKFTGVGEPSWIGLRNYDRILSRDRYTEALQVTLFFTVFVVTVQTSAGLMIAALLQRLPAVRNFARAALFTPAMMSFVIVGYVWQFIYSPFNGGLNALLTAIGLEHLARGWLGDPNTALIAIGIAHVWMFTGYTTAIFLAGYANIDTEVLEAGRLDGAKGAKRFWYLELPLLAPSVTINVMLSTIGTLKTFELPFIMTRGGPDGATRTLSLEIIENLFRAYKFGFASALSIVMLVIVIIVAFIQNKYLRSRELQS